MLLAPSEKVYDNGPLATGLQLNNVSISLSGFHIVRIQQTTKIQPINTTFYLHSLNLNIIQHSGGTGSGSALEALCDAALYKSTLT